MNKLLFAAGLAICAAGAYAQQSAMQEAGGMKWICGGVGADGRRELATLESQANLTLTFVTVKRGGYLADVGVQLYGAGAKSPLLQFTAGGPLCLLAVPAGRYRIEAAFGGAKRSTEASVAKDAKHALRVALAFPDEPWDGIRASDEEKRQAKEPW